MASIYQRYRKELNSYDRELLSLYGMLPEQLENTSPLFGSGQRLPLASQLEVSENGLYPATLLNLSRHFGFTCLPEHVEIIRQINPRFVRDVENTEKARFYHSFVMPVRQYCENNAHTYLYTLGEVRIETNKKTGQLHINVGGERVLSLLPDSVQSAMGYKVHENTIKLLAPQVIHVIQNQLGRGSVREVKELLRKMDGWFELVDPNIKKQFHRALKISGPCIASQRAVNQLMLAM